MIVDPSADIATTVRSRPGDAFTIQSGSTAWVTGIIMHARSTMPKIHENVRDLKIAQRYSVVGTNDKHSFFIHYTISGKTEPSLYCRANISSIWGFFS
jgi:hypothetical protein